MVLENDLRDGYFLTLFKINGEWRSIVVGALAQEVRGSNLAIANFSLLERKIFLVKLFVVL